MANTYTDLLKLRKPALGDVGWDDEVNSNTEIAEFVLGSILKSNVVIDGLVPSDGGGLDVDTTAGNVVVGGSAFAVGSGSKTCSSGVINWLYVDDAGALQVATTQPTGNYVALAMIDAGSSTITRIADARNFAEGALTIGVTHTPENYEADTTKTGAINQHLAGVDTQLGFMGGFKNKLINGGFDIWQRGTSQTGTSYGSDDRWLNHHAGSSKTNSRITFSTSTSVPGYPIYYCRVVATTASGAGDNVQKEQRIESVRTLAGQTATLSFWAKADAAKDIAVEFGQSFGTGGSPSSIITGIEVTTFPLTTIWAKYTATVDIPSIAGKTIGTDGNDYLSVRFWFDAGSDFDSRTNSLGNQSGTFELAQIQLELGEVATPFEQRDIAGLELALCQRYYETGSSFRRVYYQYSASYRQMTGVDFRVSKRGTPTITEDLSDTVYSYRAQDNGFAPTMSASGTTGDSGYYVFSWTAASEL